MVAFENQVSGAGVPVEGRTRGGCTFGSASVPCVGAVSVWPTRRGARDPGLPRRVLGLRRQRERERQGGERDQHRQGAAAAIRVHPRGSCGAGRTRAPRQGPARDPYGGRSRVRGKRRARSAPGSLRRVSRTMRAPRLARWFARRSAAARNAPAHGKTAHAPAPGARRFVLYPWRAAALPGLRRRRRGRPGLWQGKRLDTWKAGWASDGRKTDHGVVPLQDVGQALQSDGRDTDQGPGHGWGRPRNGNDKARSHGSRIVVSIGVETTRATGRANTELPTETSIHKRFRTDSSRAGPCPGASQRPCPQRSHGFQAHRRGESTGRTPPRIPAPLHPRSRCFFMFDTASPKTLPPGSWLAITVFIGSLETGSRIPPRSSPDGTLGTRLDASQVPRIYKAMARRAGLPEDVAQALSGHSARVGAARSARRNSRVCSSATEREPLPKAGHQVRLSRANEPEPRSLHGNAGAVRGAWPKGRCNGYQEVAGPPGNAAGPPRRARSDVARGPR